MSKDIQRETNVFSTFLMKNALESIAGIILVGVLLSFCSLGFAVTAVSLLFNRRIREL